MSVIAVGGERFAVGIEWEGELLKGRDASQLGWDNGRPWTVDVGDQTGFVDGEGSPGGARPLAGALRRLWTGEAGREESWIAAIEEDREEGGPEPAVAVVRCNRGVLLADGEAVFDTAEEALEELAQARSENVPLLVTAGLAERAPEAQVIAAGALVEAAAGVAAVVELRAPGRRGQVAKLAAILAATVGIGGPAAVYGPGLVALAWEEWFAEKQLTVPILPRVDVAVSTPALLKGCIEGFAGSGVRMAGFDRVSVHCRSAFAAGRAGAPFELEGRPVLEVRWKLRKPLQTRVYSPLAERAVRRWNWGGVKNDGSAVGVNLLPRVLVPVREMEEEPAVAFRERLDRTLAVQGFGIEYRDWGSPVEVLLTTGRPLREAAVLVVGVPGLEVVQAVWAEGLWRFEGRRTKPRNMLKSAFDALTGSASGQANAGEDRLEEAADG